MEIYRLGRAGQMGRWARGRGCSVKIIAIITKVFPAVVCFPTQATFKAQVWSEIVLVKSNNIVWYMKLPCL